MKDAGQGMAICKSIVDRFGGKIKITSKINEGSAFSFTIPNQYVAPKSKKIGSIRELAAKHRKKILLAETSLDDAQFICNVLKNKYDVVQISDYKRILSYFILDQPNLVLISMKVDHTLDIIKKIRAISTSTPVIVMTTSDFFRDQSQAIESGCTDVIAKPFSASKLEKTVMAFIT